MNNIEFVEAEKSVEIWIEGEFWKKIHKSFYNKCLKQISSFEEAEELREFILRLEKKEIKRLLLQQLSKKRCFSHELLKKIKRYHLEEKEAQTQIEAFKQLGYINDEEGLAIKISQRIQKGEGPYLIASKLRDKCGLSRDQIFSLIEKQFPENEQLIQMKKLVKKKDLTDRRKIFQFLQRRGFLIHLIQKIHLN